MKNFTKLIAMILTAVMVLSVTDPTAVRAENWTANGGTNTGEIDDNRGTIDDNQGVVRDNHSVIIANNGRVSSNKSDIETNNHTVEANEGFIDSNHGSIIINTNYARPHLYTVMYDVDAGSWDKGVKVNETDGEIDANEGAVRTNHGTIGKNTAFIQQNMGGAVTLNRSYGIVYKTGAGGKVVNNFGTVENFTGIGTIENQYAGNVGDRYVSTDTITNYFGGSIGN
nr:hypothetical protein [Lachnospiraceae bacterium]